MKNFIKSILSIVFVANLLVACSSKESHNNVTLTPPLEGKWNYFNTEVGEPLYINKTYTDTDKGEMLYMRAGSIEVKGKTVYLTFIDNKGDERLFVLTLQFSMDYVYTYGATEIYGVEYNGQKDPHYNGRFSYSKGVYTVRLHSQLTFTDPQGNILMPSGVAKFKN